MNKCTILGRILRERMLFSRLDDENCGRGGQLKGIFYYDKYQKKPGSYSVYLCTEQGKHPLLRG